MKFFKNIKSILLLTLLCLFCVCVLLFVACNDNKVDPVPSQHEHHYAVHVKDATCLEAGLTTYTCSECGHTEQEIIPAKGHDFSYEKNSTSHRQVCSRCGYFTDWHEHDFVTENVEAGHVNVCKDCEYSDLVSHNYVTEFDGTEHWQKCQDCSFEKPLSRQAHLFSQIVDEHASTCTEAGYKITKCQCGAQHTEQLDLAEHKFTVTCSNDIEHWTVCEECRQEQPNSRQQHNFDILVSFSASTCTKQGRDKGRNAFACRARLHKSRPQRRGALDRLRPL